MATRRRRNSALWCTDDLRRWGGHGVRTPTTQAMQVTSRAILRRPDSSHRVHYLILIAVALFLIALLDHATGDVPFQHLYYLPIILAAIEFGFPGGLMVSLIFCTALPPDEHQASPYSRVSSGRCSANHSFLHCRLGGRKAVQRRKPDALAVDDRRPDRVT